VKKPVRSLSSNSLSALAEEFAAGDDEAEGGDGKDVGLTLESSSLLSPSSSSSSSSSSPFQRTPARKKEAPPPTIFMIHEGVCEVLRVIVNNDDDHDNNNDNALNGDDGGNDDDESGLSFEHVGFRRKGNFVSSDPSQILDLKGKQNNPFGAAGGNGSVKRDARYVVRAQGPVVVVVLDPSDMKWAQEHDFRLESELHKVGLLLLLLLLLLLHIFKRHFLDLSSFSVILYLRLHLVPLCQNDFELCQRCVLFHRLCTLAEKFSLHCRLMLGTPPLRCLLLLLPLHPLFNHQGVLLRKAALQDNGETSTALGFQRGLRQEVNQLPVG
jgi:hypothetical protein